MFGGGEVAYHAVEQRISTPMKMLNGRRPRRPDDNFYRESRRSALGGRGHRERLGFVTVIVLIGVVVAVVAWWLLRGNP